MIKMIRIDPGDDQQTNNCIKEKFLHIGHASILHPFPSHTNNSFEDREHFDEFLGRLKFDPGGLANFVPSPKMRGRKRGGTKGKHASSSLGASEFTYGTHPPTHHPRSSQQYLGL